MVLKVAASITWDFDYKSVRITGLTSLSSVVIPSTYPDSTCHTFQIHTD